MYSDDITTCSIYMYSVSHETHTNHPKSLNWEHALSTVHGQRNGACGRAT